MESSKEIRYAEFASSPNIALIKYWGKLDDYYNLPLNSSISLTLDKSKIRSFTKIREEPGSDKVSFSLNGESAEVSKIHKKALEYFQQQTGSIEKWSILIESENNFPTAAGMASSASGFAAFACCLANLVGYFKTKESEELESYFERKWIEFADTLKKFKENTDETKKLVLEIGRIVSFTSMVRQLSGSACRSLFKGYCLLRGPENLLRSQSFLSADHSISTLRHVLTNFGIDCPEDFNLDLPDCLFPPTINPPPSDLLASMLSRHYGIHTFTDSLRRQLHFACTAMPMIAYARLKDLHGSCPMAELAVSVVVMDSRRKLVGSKAGMIDSSKTSDFLIHRVATLARRIEACIRYIVDGDIDDLLSMITTDSNSFHAVCADTRPSLRYVTDTSFTMMHMIDELNRADKVENDSMRFAVSFDAGPNPFIFSRMSDMHMIASLMSNVAREITGLPEYEKACPKVQDCEVKSKFEMTDIQKVVVNQIESVYFSIKHN